MSLNKIDEKREIYYVTSAEHESLSDLHPKVTGRASLVDGLIDAYGLKKYMKVVCPKLCSRADLLTFHTNDFVECVSAIQEYFDEQKDENEKTEVENLDYSDIIEDINKDIVSHGFGYDCEVFPNMFKYIQTVVGATLTAADMLLQSECATGDIAINFSGGWHHAHVDEVAGFCYVNDIVIGILHLMKRFKKIMYIDFDIHHGDGVEEAFRYSNKVLTLSLHKFCNGFFPGTGSVEAFGKGGGKYHTINIPLLSGINDKSYEEIFSVLFNQLYDVYKAEVIVCQCGADMLNGDPLGGFNLTDKCLSKCMKYVLEKAKPTLILGGGGYNLPNAARCWTRLIAGLLDIELEENIPEHDSLELYGPDFCLSISSSNRKDENTFTYLSLIIKEVTDLVKLLKLCQESDKEIDKKDKENKGLAPVDTSIKEDLDILPPLSKRRTLGEDK